MYVCAQTGLTKDVEVQKYNNLSQEDQVKNYLSIGHEEGTNQLWVYTPKKGLQTFPGGQNVFHHIVWPYLEWDRTFRGRVQEKDSIIIVTMIPPLNVSEDTINSLISKLYVEFNADKVLVFN